MCELSQVAAESIVFFVVHRILEVVALSDGVFAVVVVGFVGVEVYFAEESEVTLVIKRRPEIGRYRLFLVVF